MGALLGMVLGTGLLLVWLAVSELQGASAGGCSSGR
jgi:hypothetical protein